MMRRLAVAILVELIVVCLFLAPTEAVPLSPGDSVVPNDLGTGFTGSLVTSLLDVPFSIGGGATTGSIDAWVYDPDGPGGSLDFWYQITNDGDSEDSVVRTTVVSFGGWTTDVFYFESPLGSVIPSSVDRSASGNTVGFSFPILGDTDIDPGDVSALLLIRTNAPAAGVGTLTVIDGGAASVVSFAPVPEPGTLFLLGAGLSGLGFLARRRLGRGVA